MTAAARMDDPPVEERIVTIDDAMTIAIQLQRNGQVDDAAMIFRKVMEVAPGNARALHYAGVLAHQQGRKDDAVALIEKSLALQPDCADWHSNFGIVLRHLGRIDEAMAAIRRAIALDPAHVNARSNLGSLLRVQGKLDEAEAEYRAAIALDATHIDAYINLGNLLTAQRRVPEAVACFCRVMTLNPKHAEGRRRLAFAHTVLGELDKAIGIFESWLEEEPDNPIARHMLAACSGREVPVRASDAFVADVFDGFAASFESRLAHLGYRAPALVASMLEDAGVPPSKSLDVLDAGCGTGLCGPLIAPYARRLIGIDLSAGMLAQAAEKHVYDDLEREELTAWIGARRDAFDVIVSADTLVYFGALEDVARAAAQALRRGGLLIFTVEELTDAADARDFCLRPHGRYNHASAYVERVLAGAGLRPVIARAELRTEGGVPVAGLVVRAAKPLDYARGEPTGDVHG